MARVTCSIKNPKFVTAEHLIDPDKLVSDPKYKRCALYFRRKRRRTKSSKRNPVIGQISERRILSMYYTLAEMPKEQADKAYTAWMNVFLWCITRYPDVRIPNFGRIVKKNPPTKIFQLPRTREVFIIKPYPIIEILLNPENRKDFMKVENVNLSNGALGRNRKGYPTAGIPFKLRTMGNAY